MTATPDRDQSAIGVELLAYLRATLDEQALELAEPPARLTGGYDTSVYAFRLAGASDEFAGPLVLRVFPASDRGERAVFEAAVQNAAADGGCAAPRVLLAEADRRIGGGAFTVMERVPGRSMGDLILGPSLAMLRFPAWLADEQARLHELDTGPLEGALGAAGIPLERLSVEGWFAHLERLIDGAGLTSMRPGMEWLLANRPPAPDRLAICHGDFHPLNVLMEDGAVTGVVDWPNARIADPALDVGTTIMILTLGPAPLPRPLQPAFSVLRRYLARRYVAAYLRHRPLEEQSVRYYTALRCFAAMAAALADPGRGRGYAWGIPSVFAGLRSRFARVSGVELQVEVPDTP